MATAIRPTTGARATAGAAAGAWVTATVSAVVRLTTKASAQASTVTMRRRHVPNSIWIMPRLLW